MLHVRGCRSGIFLYPRRVRPPVPAKVNQAVDGLIIWSDELSVDHPGLDHDHKVLFNLVNGLQAMREGDGPLEDLHFIVGRLETTLVQHFVSEERHLLASGYAQLKEHQKEHHTLLRSFAALKPNFTRHDRAVSRGDLAEGILQFMHDVTLKHILRSDLHYRDVLRKNNIAGSGTDGN